MVPARSVRIWICIAVAIGSMALIPAARAANDTARFRGKWRTSFSYNGQTITLVSIHDGRGFKNYTLVPNGALPAGDGTFSAADGKWTASSAPPNNAGTYHFTNGNTVVCTNALGRTVVWQRDDSPLPPVAPTDQELMAKYRKAADAGVADAMNSIGLMYDNGQGVPRDDQQAMAWYRKAAAGGNPMRPCNSGLTTVRVMACLSTISRRSPGIERLLMKEMPPRCAISGFFIGMGGAFRWITISPSTGAGRPLQRAINAPKSG
jgi:hypothetical protein